MSRLTGKDALGLFEAYNAVYTPQEEISEEQIWEEVEEWVTSLVEEGYDLSEFTWEEMYEAYITEVASKGGAADPYGASGAAKPAAKPQMKGLSIGKGGFNVGGKPVNPGMSPIFQRPGAKPSAAPAAKPAPSAAARPASAARPSAAPAARPAATSTSAAKPASTPAAAKPAPSAAAKPAAAAPAKTPNPLMQKTFGYQTGGAPDQVKSASTPAAAKPTPKPTPAATGSKKPGSVYSSFDMFDVVKGHLIDEGYADTEEAAIAIMANMSEEWKSSIINEEITSAKGKAKAAEMIAKRSTPSGRAKAGQGANVATIKHIGSSNREGLGGTPSNRKTAGSNRPKSYSGIGGTGNKAARRAAELKKEEFVGEAQVANRDPENYEREQDKKTAPVRGERTPMPPRGNKKREDFEKWYAKNVR